MLPDVIDCLSDAGIRARPVVPVLEGLLNDKKSGLRSRAGLAIVAIEGQASPRAVEILVQMVADPKIPQSDRESAIAQLRGANSASLAKPSSDLIRQLGDSDVDVRQNAFSLLSMIIDETRALMPVPALGK